MAKQSTIARNEYRKRQVEKYKAKRAELLAIIRDPKVSEDSRDEAYRALRKLPRDASPTRIRNRCNVTGRSRGYYRKFGLSRIALRDLALRGDLPGVTKSSWLGAPGHGGRREPHGTDRARRAFARWTDDAGSRRRFGVRRGA